MHIPEFHHIIIYVNLVLALLANSVLIYLILFHTKEHMAMYSKLMLAFAVFNIFFPVIYVFIAPIIYMDGYGFIMFATGLFSTSPISSRIGLIMYASAFAQSLTLLCFHFVYRYALICQSQWLNKVDNATMVIVLVIVFFAFSGGYAVNVDIFLIDNVVVKEGFEGKMKTVFDADIHEMSILGGLFFKTHPNGTTSAQPTSFIGMTICILFIVGTFVIIFYCGISIFATLRKASMSASTRKMQMGIFKALVVQTLIPTICEYVPSGITLLCPIFHVNVDATFVTLFISVYSVLEPWVMIYFVNDYKIVFLQKIGCSTCVPQRKMSMKNSITIF